MAKLAALLAALLLVAHVASAFRTIITIDEDNLRGGSREQCGQEIQQRNLDHCTRYLMEQQRGRGYDDELNVSHYDKCCSELRKIQDEQCQCEGLEMEMQSEIRQGRMRPQDMKQMMQSARRLPIMCGTRRSECQFDMPYY